MWNLINKLLQEKYYIEMKVIIDLFKSIFELARAGRDSVDENCIQIPVKGNKVEQYEVP